MGLLYRSLYESRNAFLYNRVDNKIIFFTFCNISLFIALTEYFWLGNNEINGIQWEILESSGKKG
jgi:hypothetical protein